MILFVHFRFGQRHILLAMMAIGCTLFQLSCYSLQRNMLYHPSHQDSQKAGNDPFKPLVTPEGTFLGYVREVTSPTKVLLYFHGNAGDAIHRKWLETLDPQRKMIIVLAEYPGFGGREGIATENAIFESSVEIYDELSKRYQLPITAFGESLGTGVACYLASQRELSSLALAAPFTSAVDVASQAFWYFPIRPIMKDKYNSMLHLKEVKIPLRIIHGTEDNLIPITHGRRLLEAYTGTDKAIYEIPNFGHNDLANAIQSSVEAEEFRAFLRK